LNPSNALRRLAVGGAAHLPLKGPRGAQEPLELQAGDHVGTLAIPVFSPEFWAEPLHSQGQDNGPHGKGENLLLLGVVNGLRLADLNALHTFGANATVETALGLGQGLGPGKTPLHLLEAPYSLVWGNLRHRFAGLGG